MFQSTLSSNSYPHFLKVFIIKFEDVIYPYVVLRISSDKHPLDPGTIDKDNSGLSKYES